MERGDRFDAIVVGGGHNGLTAAAYLARAGLSVCALERRDVLGGACVTEEVWPGRRVSRASYVVSMLQPKVVEDLRLRDFGYDPIPLDPSYGSIADATPLLFFTDVARTQASIAQFSKRDAEAYPAFEEVRGYFNGARSAVRHWLDSATPKDLATSLKEATGGFANDPVDAMLKVCWHEGWHLGQVATLRKHLGLSSAF